MMHSLFYSPVCCLSPAVAQSLNERNERYRALRQPRRVYAPVIHLEVRVWLVIGGNMVSHNVMKADGGGGLP